MSDDEVQGSSKGWDPMADGMGRLPEDMFESAPAPEPMDHRAIAIAQLSELLEWERKARKEAQDQVSGLEMDLHKLKLDSMGERKRLELELAQALAASDGADGAEIALQDATQRFKEELDALRKQLRALEKERAESMQGSGQLESQLRAAERAAADAASERKRMAATARRTGVQLTGLREHWTACQLALTEQAIETRSIFDQAKASFAKVSAVVLASEAAEKKKLEARSAEASNLVEQLAAAKGEAKKYKDELAIVTPSLKEAEKEVKRLKADHKRLQELCERLKDERADAAALEKARDEALANAFAAVITEKKLRSELEAERQRTSRQEGRAVAAEGAALEARAEVERLQGERQQLQERLAALEAQNKQSGPQVSAQSLRNLESAARDLYISGGRHLEPFLKAMAKLEVHNAVEDEVVGVAAHERNAAKAAQGAAVAPPPPPAGCSGSGSSSRGSSSRSGVLATGHAGNGSCSGGSRSGGSRGSSASAEGNAVPLGLVRPSAGLDALPMPPANANAPVAPSPWADCGFGGKARSSHVLTTSTGRPIVAGAAGAARGGRLAARSAEMPPAPPRGGGKDTINDGLGAVLSPSSSMPSCCPPVVRGGSHGSAPSGEHLQQSKTKRAGGYGGAGERMRMAP